LLKLCRVEAVERVPHSWLLITTKISCHNM